METATTRHRGDADDTGLLGRDIRALVPATGDVPHLIDMDPPQDRIWRRAAPYLRVRDNDAHTLYAFGIARALLDQVPGARPEIVLPAILLHDVGWSTVPEELVLEAIAPRPRHPELVRVHEIEGAAIARSILGDLGTPDTDIDEIAAIIDGHDSRREATSPSDAVVKDADKLWRITPHGLATVGRWFGLAQSETLRLVGSRTHAHLCTEPARVMARAFAAIASTDVSPQLRELSSAATNTSDTALYEHPTPRFQE
ncbi:HD domain-containing protein [Rhodococcus sp. TAF43]|uniref:HD domain-containing protein n=1 Tax=unclassified Rhodococcus (in: high G+C Gram-positive bacteria) TaxID=192944 RepID=UPI000E0A57C6|nr:MULTISPECIES: HD domain-containing protein [unclassified Rhodococcus (in: high G+C Gram-positive bacteria)]QKT12706.1 HD domain-containing protein [Rhodococcus sp. W8901]RDI34042.1 HD domain-containing protein [Rhodococcus sp. AG1013]